MLETRRKKRFRKKGVDTKKRKIIYKKRNITRRIRGGIGVFDRLAAGLSPFSKDYPQLPSKEASERLLAEAEQQRQREVEKQRLAEIEAKKEENKRKKADKLLVEEQKRLAEIEAKIADAEKQRLDEMEAKKARLETKMEEKKSKKTEKQKLAEKEEKQRLAEEEKQRLAEEEKQRLVEEEKQRLAEEEKQRLEVENKQRLAEEAHRLAETEKQRLAETEKQRLVETEKQRLVEEDVANNPEVYTYWTPFFTDETSLYALKNQFKSIIENKQICSIVKRIIPKYDISAATKAPNDAYDEEIYELCLCFVMLLFGIISNKMKTNGNYNISFKGGKAIQLILSKIQNSQPYMSNDVDVLVMVKPGKTYNPEEIKQVSIHISKLIEWIKKDLPFADEISIQLPDPTFVNRNQNLVKFSIKNGKKNETEFYFKAFSDIDFKELPSHIKQYFMETELEKDTCVVPELTPHNLLFRYPNIDSIINEKLYYLIYYIILEYKNNIEYETLLAQQKQQQKPFDKKLFAPYIKIAKECEYNLGKIVRALNVLLYTKALIETKSTLPSLNNARKTRIVNEKIAVLFANSFTDVTDIPESLFINIAVNEIYPKSSTNTTDTTRPTDYDNIVNNVNKQTKFLLLGEA